MTKMTQTKRLAKQQAALEQFARRSGLDDTITIIRSPNGEMRVSGITLSDQMSNFYESLRDLCGSALCECGHFDARRLREFADEMEREHGHSLIDMQPMGNA